MVPKMHSVGPEEGSTAGCKRLQDGDEADRSCQCGLCPHIYEVYEMLKTAIDKEEAKRGAKRYTLQNWQATWESDNRSRCTARLLGSLAP